MANYEIREQVNSRFGYTEYQAYNTETGEMLGNWTSKREYAEEDITSAENGTQVKVDLNLFQSAWNADGTNKPMPEQPVATEPAMPEEVIIEADERQEIGSTIEYKGQQWTVTNSEFYSAQNQVEDETGGMGSLTVGWHSWLRKAELSNDKNWGGKREGAGRPRQYVKVPATPYTERSERQPLTPESDLTICIAETDERQGIVIGNIWYGKEEALAVARYVQEHL